MRSLGNRLLPLAVEAVLAGDLAAEGLESEALNSALRDVESLCGLGCAGVEVRQAVLAANVEGAKQGLRLKEATS